MEELERNIMDFKEGTNIQSINDKVYFTINFSLFKDIFKDETDINILADKYNERVNDELKIKIKKKQKWLIDIPHKIIYNYINKIKNK